MAADGPWAGDGGAGAGGGASLADALRPEPPTPGRAAVGRGQAPGAPPDGDALAQALRRVLGFEAFRPGQREALESVLAGRDTLAILPTGGGKSVTYTLPAFLLPGTTLVVSPLIALMQDQVAKLEARGLPATCLGSQVPWEEQARRLERLRRGELKLLLVAPERFRNERFRRCLEGVRVSLFAVDEAHCVSQWGHDFRPDYLRLGEVVRALGRPPVLAVTATATKRVRDDIARQLELGPELTSIVRGFDRPNLHLAVEDVAGGKKEKLRRLLALARAPGPGIVYCATRKNAEQVALELGRARPGKVGVYHAGLEAGARARVQDAFFAGALDVIVATNAFGLGIDKQDVRWVLHHDLPGSLEAYYQEAGRAGRDGAPARCALLFTWQDVHVQRWLIETAHPSPALVRAVDGAARRVGPDPAAIRELLGGRDPERAVAQALRLLEEKGGDPAAVDFAALEARERHEEALLQRLLDYTRTAGCRRAAILRYFGAEPLAASAPGRPGGCANCDRCLGEGAGEAATLAVRDPGARRTRAPGAAKRAGAGSKRAGARAGGEPVVPGERSDRELALLERLRRLRSQLAERDRVAPYRVFHDRTLEALAQARPRSRAGLLEVHGLGERKVERWGDDLLAVLLAT